MPANPLFHKCFNVALASSFCLIGATCLVIYTSSKIKELTPQPHYEEEPTELPKEKDYQYLSGKDTVFLLVKHKADNTYPLLDLYDEDNKEQKLYACAYEESENIDIQNEQCLLYQLSTDPLKQDTVDASAAVTDTTIIKNRSDLRDKKKYLLKLSKDFWVAMKEKETSRIKLLSTKDKESGENLIANLDILLELDTPNYTVNHTTAESNLFILSLNEDTPFMVKIPDEPLTCKLQTEELKCKLYYLTDDKKNINTSTLSKITPLKPEHLKKGNLLVVELIDSKRNLLSLDGTIEIYDKHATYGEGLAEQLVVGNINPPKSSTLLLVSDSYHDLIDGPVKTTEGTSHIMTKGSEPKYIQHFTTYRKDDFFCRVISGNYKYDDENCNVYQFPKSGKSNFNPEDYVGWANSINDLEHLKEDTYQFVQVKKQLQRILMEEEGSTLHLVNKSLKNKKINNKLIDFNIVYHATYGKENWSDIKTDLFLVKFTSKIEPKASITLKKSDSLFCFGINNENQPCKLYKFKDPKFSQPVTPEEIRTMSQEIGNHEVVQNNLYILEFPANRYEPSDLQNKEIFIRNGTNNQIIGYFNYQLTLYGKALMAALPQQRKDVFFIAKKEAEEPIQEDTDSYRCFYKYKVKNTDFINTDLDCKLIKLGDDDPKKIYGYKNVLTDSEKSPLDPLIDPEQKHLYYKLLIDENSLFAFPFDNFLNQKIYVEFYSTSSKKSQNIPFTIFYKWDGSKYIGAKPSVLARVNKKYFLDDYDDRTQIPHKCYLDFTETAQKKISTTSCSMVTTTPDQITNIDELRLKSAIHRNNFAPGNHLVVSFEEPYTFSDIQALKTFKYEVPWVPPSKQGWEEIGFIFDVVALVDGNIKALENMFFLTEPK